MSINYDVILSPVITEKATRMTEANQVVFRVTLDATKPAIAKAVADYRRTRPGEAVLLATGIAHEAMGEPITRQILDRMVADIPFIIGCFDHHTMWANTKALEAAGIMKGRDLPVGNEIVLDHNGIATGELREPAAYMLAQALTPTGGREWLGMTTGESPVPPATAAQRALDMVIEYAPQRKTFGLPLSERQAIQFWVAEAATKIHAARLMTYDCAWKQDNGRDVRSEISMIKWFATEMAYETVDRAMQAFGAMGMTKELPLQLMQAKLRTMRIYDGPTEVHKWVVARNLLGTRR